MRKRAWISIILTATLIAAVLTLWLPVGVSIDMRGSIGISLNTQQAYAAPDSSIIGNRSAASSAYNNLENYIVGMILHFPADGEVSSITAYIYCSTAAKNMKCAIYDASNLADSSPIANGVSNQQSIAVGTTFYTFTFPTNPTLVAGDYLVVVWSASGGGYARLFYETVPATFAVYSKSQTYNTFPSNVDWTALSTTSRRPCLYCTWIPTGGTELEVETDDDYLAYRYATTWTGDSYSPDLNVGFNYASYENRYGFGVHFSNITIPNGATIITAYVILTANATRAFNTVNGIVTGEKVANAAVFSDLADYQARRGTIVGGATDDYITDEQVDWWTLPPVGVAIAPFYTPEISPIIQEIVNQASWESGNSLVLWIDDYDNRSTQSDQRYRIFSGIAEVTYAAPKIHIVYIESGGGPEITNTPATWNIGIIDVNTTSNTAINNFQIENTGSGAVDVTAQTTSSTNGGSTPWTCSTTATPDTNVYGLKIGLDDADDNFDIIIRSDIAVEIINNLAEDATQDWGMKVWMPTAVTGYDGEPMTATVTLVASVHS